MEKKNLIILSLCGFVAVGGFGIYQKLLQKDEIALRELRGIVEQHKQSEAPLKSLMNKDADKRITNDITSQIPRVNPDEAVKLSEVVLDKDESPYVKNEALDLFRRSNDPNYKELLMKKIKDKGYNELDRDFDIQHLAVIAKKAKRKGDNYTVEEITDVLVNIVDDQKESDLARRDAFLGLVRIRHKYPKDLIIGGLIDLPEFDFMKDLSIRAAQKYDVREVLPVVRSYIHSENNVVQVAAINSIGNWGDVTSVPELKELAKNKKNSSQLNNTIKAALEKL